MTDFVIEQYPKFNPFGSDEDCRIFDIVFAYAKFLKEPLTLGFIENNFASIELKSMTDDSWIFKINGKFPFIIRKTMTVESLLIYNTKFELTESAQKQIGIIK